jgi:hypothetical protein
VSDDFSYESPFPTLRRIYLKNRKLTAEAGEHAISSVWQARQEEQPGTGLPSDFPYRDELVAAGYSTSEDLEGACADELAEWAGISGRDAKTILAAYAAL